MTFRDRDGSEVRLLVDDDAESSDGDEGICETETVSTESCDAFLKRGLFSLPLNFFAYPAVYV